MYLKPPSYLLWSGRMSGWLTKASTYASDITSAARYSHEDALALAVRHMNNGFSEFGLLPVAEADIALMREAKQ